MNDVDFEQKQQLNEPDSVSPDLGEDSAAAECFRDVAIVERRQLQVEEDGDILWA